MKNFNEIYEKIYKENQEPLEKMRKESYWLQQRKILDIFILVKY